MNQKWQSFQIKYFLQTSPEYTLYQRKMMFFIKSNIIYCSPVWIKNLSFRDSYIRIMLQNIGRKWASCLLIHQMKHFKYMEYSIRNCKIFWFPTRLHYWNHIRCPRRKVYPYKEDQSIDYRDEHAPLASLSDFFLEQWTPGAELYENNNIIKFDSSVRREPI